LHLPQLPAKPAEIDWLAAAQGKLKGNRQPQNRLHLQQLPAKPAASADYVYCHDEFLNTILQHRCNCPFFNFDRDTSAT
jgi:hypothetical protein